MRRLLLIIAALAMSAPARADGSDPWAVGVTDEQKARAQALLEEGNAQFLDRKFAEALATYMRAAAAWDHPAIRFNMVRCLIQLGRPVEAYEDLEIALRYGKAPLEESVYEEALGYQTLLQAQIAEVAVTCAQAGVAVTLDGQPMIARCPGRAARRLAPGAHQVVAREDGYMTLTRDLVVLPAASETVDVALVPIEAARVTVRRWTPWKPWAVALAGGAVVVGGGLLEWKSSSDFAAYDREIARECPDRGCDPADVAGPVAALERRARSENRVAVGALAAGGAAVITGAVLLYLNRPHLELPQVSPVTGGATISASIHF